MTLLLECNADEVVARALGVPRQSIIHSHGKGRVSQSLNKRNNVVALVDEDPGSPDALTLSRFVEVEHNHDVRHKRDKAHGNRLVVVCPKLEDWLIKTAKGANVKMSDFNLNERAGDLHADINQRLPNLQRLLNRLLELQNPRLLHLKSLLAD